MSMLYRQPTGSSISLGTLYVITTPIGNLEDISARAVNLLREVRLVAAEDTRRTRNLLSHFGIRASLTSYFEHNNHTKLAVIMTALQSGDVALVSDGGTPTISDPGYRLVRAAIDRGYRVVPVPGPSALLAGLVASGLPTDAFVFLGFLPRKSSARCRLLAENACDRRTLVAFEAPHRLLSALGDIETEMGDRQLVVARELTKVHEEIFRGTAGGAQDHFSREGVRGEITLIIAGCPESRQEIWSEARVRAALRAAVECRVNTSQIARGIAERSGWLRSDVYRMAIEEDL